MFQEEELSWITRKEWKNGGSRLVLAMGERRGKIQKGQVEIFKKMGGTGCNAIREVQNSIA